MARYNFGEPLSEDDILVVQGVEYPMVPIGLRAMRRLLTIQRQLAANRKEGEAITDDELDIALELVVAAVRVEHRERFKEHIEESVSPDMLVQIATAVMRSFSDVDPTQPESSSGGSQQTGLDLTAGALPEVSTPTS